LKQTLSTRQELASKQANAEQHTPEVVLSRALAGSAVADLVIFIEAMHL